METVSFIKMHGLGNDFVIIDNLDARYSFTKNQIQQISDRKIGVGCDQFIVLEKSPTPKASLFMRIYNPDGSEAEACGNATRCVARLIFEKDKTKTNFFIETLNGLLEIKVEDENSITANMGVAKLEWDQIPLSKQCDTNALPLDYNKHLNNPVAVNVGNPHCVFFVSDMEQINISTWGKDIEAHELFPNKTNVEFAQILSDNTIRMRVWERSAGITQACGSAACATLIAAVRRGLIPNRKAEIIMDGGSLFIEWLASGHVLMTGPTTKVFEGQFILD